MFLPVLLVRLRRVGMGRLRGAERRRRGGDGVGAQSRRQLQDRAAASRGGARVVRVITVAFQLFFLVWVLSWPPRGYATYALGAVATVVFCCYFGESTLAFWPQACSSRL